MNLPLRKPATIPAFLEWENGQEFRYEFDGFRPVAMTGGTAAHAAIQRNLAIAVGGRLRGKPCQFYGNDLKVEVAGRIRYPDGFVICSAIPRDEKLVRDPVVIFEILSEATARTDLITKNREYATTPSVRRYLVLSQNEIGGTMFERSGEDWVGHLLATESIVHMPEIGIDLPIAELYEDIDLVADEPEAPG
ncbi:MAG TPA: Uma2 family endonuclease [Rhizomicrobium sp.]|nr:Uma2 family endonuclease [Rhizomicrobium sp.]